MVESPAISVRELADELGTDPKSIRSWMRRQRWRHPADSGDPWVLSPTQAQLVRTHFVGNAPHPSPAPSGNEGLAGATVGELLDRYTDVLTELRHRGLVRTYNAPIGDLAEYCAAIVYDGLLAPNSEKSYDLVAVDGRKVQVKVRVRRADTSSSATFSVIRSFDFDVCLFLLIDSDGEVAAAREWTVQEVRDAGRHKPHINGSVVRLSQVTSGSALGIDRLAEFRQAGRELAAQTR